MADLDDTRRAEAWANTADFWDALIRFYRIDRLAAWLTRRPTP
jgi:hypothetical protein